MSNYKLIKLLSKIETYIYEQKHKEQTASSSLVEYKISIMIAECISMLEVENNANQ